MPELPEVESVRKGLEKLVRGETIASVDVFWDRIISYPNNVEQFKEKLSGEVFMNFSRRGKFLIFELQNHTLVSHLRMEGKFRVTESSKPLTKHTHVVFHLKGEKDLRYADVRKFGRMMLVEKGEEGTLPSLQRLGPEPTKEALGKEYFSDQLKKRRKSIKGVLLDQSIVAGLGNIYADEVLFRAFIHPERPANTLNNDEAETLHTAVIQTMEEATKAGGTTIRTYENAFGENGSYQQSLNVYGKKGQLCIRCGTAIEKIQVAQRGTHYCPCCQK